MSSLVQDFRFGLRMLGKHPVVSAIAVLTLALGIGANTAIFSVVNAVMLRPLPYRDPDRLVSLWANVPEHGRWRVSPANFFDWKKQNTVFENIAAFGAFTLTLTGNGEPEQLLGTQASSGYFSVVGVEPMLGRQFRPEEYEPGKGQEIILGNAFWQTRYGGNPAIINRPITLNGDSYTVVGVMPPGIFPMWPTTTGKISFAAEQQQFWVPMSFTPGWAAVRTAHVLGVIGRMKPTVRLAQAKAEMNTIAARIEQSYPVNKGEGIVVNPFMNEMVGEVRPALFALLAAVGVVLLIACANIGGLLLAQHAARSKEVAIRAALGAGRTRLVRQFLVEGILLSLSGTVVGLIGARLSVDFISKMIAKQIPRFEQTRLDMRVLGFTFGLSLLTCLLFCLVPAWHASRADLSTTLDQGGRTSGAGGARQRFRQMLVVVQVALAVMLVIGSGLLIKSFWLLQRVDPGFNSDSVLTLTVALPFSKYSEPTRINNFFNQLVDGIEHIPGVRSAAIAYDHPLESNWIDAFSIEGRPTAPGESLSANFEPVGPDYFRTVGAQVISGRTFTPQDDQDHPGVAIVNEAFVQRYFSNEPALGRRIGTAPPARIWKGLRFTSFEIVGIARDVKSAGLKNDTEPTYYIPASQAPLQNMTVLVHTQGDPLSLITSLRRAVLAVDPNQPIADVNTMDKVVADSIAQQRLNMTLMVVFAGLALLLAVVGLYGLLSYAVTQRTQELGIRMALGAQVKDVLGLVLKEGMALAIVGEGLGVLGALALTRLLRGLLFGVAPTDLSVFVVVFSVLTIVALLACFFPARKATKVDPLIALRYE